MIPPAHLWNVLWPLYPVSGLNPDLSSTWATLHPLLLCLAEATRHHSQGTHTRMLQIPSQHDPSHLSTPVPHFFHSFCLVSTPFPHCFLEVFTSTFSSLTPRPFP